ncbi:MAG: SAM-dependent chlorinase/fluorinase [Gemmatimonadales bacterium]|jgi:S-adenosylmethionine hydrolase
MPPIITLLTDFGHSDSYVAEMKAAVLGQCPEAVVVDVTHEVVAGDVRGAQYLLHRTWKQFPVGTVHVAVIDPGVGSARNAVAAEAHGHFFVAPDNGLLTPVLDEAEVVVLPVPATASPTFHGRDVFAPAAARLAQGTLLSALGTPTTDVVRLVPPRPRVDGHTVVGEVLHIDHYGTLVTNIPADLVPDEATAVVAGHYRAPVLRTFSDVTSGELVAFVGSDGMLEVAARNRSAAQVTGAALGAGVHVQLTSESGPSAA